jgi:hypothetical protein
MILDKFAAKIESALPDCRWYVVPGDEPKVVFPAVCQDFGDIEVTEADGELTIVFGRFTHSHFASYAQNLTDAEHADLISSNAISCLADTFSDRLEFYGSHSGAGGFCRRGARGMLSKTLVGQGAHVWSGQDG